MVFDLDIWEFSPDDYVTCPKCGARTDWDDDEGPVKPGGVRHTCLDPDCAFVFMAEGPDDDPITITLTRREVATVLAGLRLLRGSEVWSALPDAGIVFEIRSEDGRIDQLSPDEADRLCDRIRGEA
ncbi:MAG: hypothetical protein ACRD1Z_13435 [Vicinamibacteria bacterium]